MINAQTEGADSKQISADEALEFGEERWAMLELRQNGAGEKTPCPECSRRTNKVWDDGRNLVFACSMWCAERIRDRREAEGR